jgi:putative phage-type endonuclease
MSAVDDRPRIAPILLGRFEVASPEWYAARLDGLGGSEIAAVLGLSKWQSRFSLWHLKAGRVREQVENEEMEWGKRLEPVVLAKWSEQHPEWTARPSGTYCHPDRRWQIANPDLVGDATDGDDQILVEAKTALYADEWGEPGTDQVPPYYLCQTRWYLDVFGLSVAHMPVLIGGHDYREYVIHQDQADVELMRREAEAFLDSLPGGAAEQRPDIDAHSATYTAVRQLADGVIDEAIELAPDLADQYIAAQVAAKAAEDEKRRLSATVLDLIGNHRHADCLTRRIATRAVKPDGTTHSLRPAKGLTEDA